MTIRLTDLEAQQRYDDKLEDYQKEVDKRIAKSSASPIASDWPMPPKRPELMADSHDEESPSSNPFGLVEPEPLPSFGRDPHFPGGVQVPHDGTAHQTPKGYETHWSASDKALAKPFTLKK